MCTKGSTKVTTRSYPFWSLRIGRENNTLPIPFDHSLYLMKIVQLQLSWGKQATATYPSVTNDLNVSIATSLHENAIFRVLTHMLLLRTLSRSRSLHPLSRSLSVARSHTQAFTLIVDTETQSHLSTEHATETQTHLSTQHRTPRQQSARASERRQACDMDGLQCSRLKVATATKVVVAGERPDPSASSHHRIIGTMQAHLRWMLAVRAAQIHEAFCVFASATAVPVLSGSSAPSSSSSPRRKRSVSSGGSSCSISVSSKSVTLRCSRVALAASLGASSNVLVHVHDAGWVHVVLRHIVSRHSAKNCMACCLMLCCEVLYHSFRGAFHDELGHDGACHGHDRRDREISLVSGANEAHPSVLHQTADPLCAESARHAMLRGLCRRWAASTRPHFPRRMGTSTSQASRGSWPFLLVLVQPSSQCPRSSCCPIQASGAAVPRAWPPSRTRPVCTARPRLASRRVSSSGLATDSSPAGLPHRAVETEVKFPSMSHACLCSLARALGCDKCGCASSSSSSSSSSSTSPDLFPATTINYRERVEGCGHVHPCSRLCFCKRTTTLPNPPKTPVKNWRSKGKKRCIHWHHSCWITLITSTICSRIRGTGTSTISSVCARPPVLSPDACTSVADDLASNKLHDFLHEPEHWHIHDLLHDAMLHALPSRLVTGIWTKGTQFHNVCFDVHRAPCESHDNLSFAASYQEHRTVLDPTRPKRKAKLWGVSWASFHKACRRWAWAARWRSPPPSTCDGVSQTQHVIKKLGLVLHWKTQRDVARDCLARRARFTNRAFSKPCSPGAPPTPTTGRYNFRRAWRPTPGRPRRSWGSPPRLRGHPAVPVLSRSLLSQWQFPPSSLQRFPHGWPCGPLPPFGRPSTASEYRWSRRSAVPRTTRRTTTWNDHHRKPCSWCFPAKRLRQQKSSPGVSCRLPRACFIITLTFRADVATIMRVMVSPFVYPRLFSTTLTFRTPQENHIVSVPFETIEKNIKNAFFYIFSISRTRWYNSKLNSRVDDQRRITETSEKLAKSLSGPLVKLSN